MAAVAENGVIGRGNALPWHLPRDLRRFKTLTLGKPILMGRRTFESIGRALPGRTSLVLTRDLEWSAAGATTVHSLEEALARCAGAAELVVIGGAEVFALALPLAQRIYLTEVGADVEGDTRFPGFDRTSWAEVERSAHPADREHAYPVTFLTLERRAAPPAQRRAVRT